MKKSINIWQRLLAFAMVCTMLVGYVPVFAAAEGDPAYEEITGFTATLVCTTTAEETKEIRNTDEPELDAGGNPVVDGEGNPVYKTEEVVVFKKVRDAFSVEGAPEGAVIEWSENNVLISSNGRYLKASMKAPETVTQLETVTKQEVIWKASVLAWNDIQACTAITAPAIEYGEGCSLDSVAWSITDANGEARTAGEEAHMSMGILTATATIGEQTFTRTAKVTYAAAEYQFSPEAGWFAEMPEVKVTAITANPKEEIAPVKVGDAAYEWVVNEEVPGSYVATIPVAENETTKTIVVDKISRVYNVDNAELSISKIYAIRYDDKTEVVFEYTTGASGATALINDQEVTLEPGENKAYQVFLTGAVENIQVKMTNILGREATASCVSIPYPTITATSPIIGYVNGVAYVGRNANYISFAMNNAYGDVTWKVESELEVSNYTIEGNEIKIYVSPDAPFEVPVGASATDSRGRSAYNGGYAKVAVDMVAPEVTVTGLQTVEETHMPAEQTYTIKATDDVVLSTVSGYYLDDANNPIDIVFTAINEKEVAAEFVVPDGTHLKKIIVTALDASGNETVETMETDVVVDTTAPVINAVLRATTDSDCHEIYPTTITEGKVYYRWLNVANNGVSAELVLTLSEANPDEATMSGWTLANGVWQKTISVQIGRGNTAEIPIGATVKDTAGNSAVIANVTVPTGGEPYIFTYAAENGFFPSLPIDAGATPQEEIDLGNVAVEIANETFAVLEGNNIYQVKEDVPLAINVSAEKVTQTLYPSVTLSGENVRLDNSQYPVRAGEKTTINVFPADGHSADLEINEIGLTISFTDVQARAISTLNFGVDNKAPRVFVQVTSNSECKANEDGRHYYKEPVILTFSMVDMLPAKAIITYTLDGNEKTETIKNGNNVFSIEIPAGSALTALSVSAEDELGNKTATIYTGTEEEKDEYTFTPIEVDNILPVLEYMLSVESVSAIDGVEYYGEEIVLGAKVTEKNIQSIELSYSVNGASQTPITLDGFAPDGENTYAATINITDGQYVSYIKLTAIDKAGNSVVDYTYENAIVVDTTAPVVTVEKHVDAVIDTPKSTDKDGLVEYYDAKVTYTITVTDNFLKEAETKVNEEVNNPFFKTEGKIVFGEVIWAEDTYSAEITVSDNVNGAYDVVDYELTDFVISASDYVGNTFGAAADYTSLQSDGTVKYNGNKIVVDETNPTISGMITANEGVTVNRVYKNPHGDYYLELTPAENHGTEDKENEKPVSVTVLFTLNEMNPNTEFLTNHGWNNNPEGSNIWTYAVTETFEENDDTKAISINSLMALDMAKRYAVADFDIAAGTAENTEEFISAIPMKVNEEVDENGNKYYSVSINVDRRTPEDEENSADVPGITVTTAPHNSKIEGTEIYIGNSVTFNLNVKDTGSGIDPLFTAEVEGKGYHHNEEVTVEENQVLVKGENGKYTGAVTVTIEEDAESNNITLNLYIKDKVGNTYHLVKTFGLDDHAPEVDVKFTENAGDGPRNVFYYKGNRHATVTVKDINLADDIDSVVQISTVMNNTTAVAASKAEKNGDTITLDYDYTADGDYTFAVTNVVDKAGHNVADQNVKYADSNRSEKDHNFTIDKTKPKIEVAYAPAAASGRDGTVSHYNQAMTAYATITEHNFSTGAEDEAGVVTNITPAGSAAFGDWSNDGDDHKSNATFQEGNNYSFTINCTDLAGNPADTYTSHTFCVDTHAPTIEITAGDLTNDELNIVQDDLTLGFTINDAQKNLSNYNVTVTKLGNDFKKTTITGSDFFTVVEQEARTTVLVNFKAIAKEKLNDGVYTVQITARDFAGNAVSLTPDLLFSLNRFGSTFMTDDEYTLKFLELGSDGNVYHQEVSDKLIIHEINPNRVYSDGSKKHEGSALTVIVNGTSTTLEEGKDYSMNISEQGSEKSRWYVYTYEIDPDTFADEGKVVDGRYSILISGEDEAGNKNTNESNVSGKLQKDEAGEYNGKIEFVLDTSAPIITTTGIESGKNYDAEAQKLQIFLSDSTPTSITVYLNGSPVALSELLAEMDEAAQWLVYDEESNSYILNVPELNTLFSGQEIRIVVVDEAGNETELFINDFSVSTNLFVRLLNSTWFIVSVIVLAILLIVLFLLKKRKKVAV